MLALQIKRSERGFYFRFDDLTKARQFAKVSIKIDPTTLYIIVPTSRRTLIKATIWSSICTDVLMTPLAIDRTADWNDVGKNRATINCNAQSTWNNWYKGKTLFDAKDILDLNFDSGALSVQTFTRGHFFVLTAQKSSGTHCAIF